LSKKGRTALLKFLVFKRMITDWIRLRYTRRWQSQGLQKGCGSVHLVDAL